jgi:hypothetical protein
MLCQLQQITRYPYLAGPATALLPAIMPYGEARGVRAENMSQSFPRET